MKTGNSVREGKRSGKGASLLIPRLLAAAGLFLGSSPWAAPVSFDDLWSRVRSRSPGLQAREEVVAAAEQAAARSALHWVPRLSLDARGVSTDDPGLNFGASLSQRGIQTADFIPAALNHPGRNFFWMAGLGLELPLFEGGMRVSTARAESKMLELERVELSGAQLSSFSDTARDYARFLSVEQSIERLSGLQKLLFGVLEKYTLGVSANPVGYSGLLGLKGLKNRIEASLRELSVERSNLQTSLARRAELPDSAWTPVSQSLDSFLARVFDSSTRPGKSAREWSAALRGEALADWKNVERARYLPQVGLFGNESLTSGMRATGTSTTVGLYLRWNLFDPENWGRLEERSRREKSARFLADSEALEKGIAEQSLLSSDATLTGNRKLLLESEQLLSEQARVAFRLFQSGSIQALQLAEVLNRRVDLVLSLKRLDEQWIQVRADLKKNSSIEGSSS